MRILAFTTCKPWKGPHKHIQSNALRSWTLWKPSPTIVIFGDDEGSAKAAQHFGATHRPQVELGDSGFPKIRDMFRQAELLAGGLNIDVLMFANADMVVAGLVEAAAAVRRQLDKFLLISYRRDVADIDLNEPQWLERTYGRSRLGPPDAIDLFCFTRGLWNEIPDFVSGHVGFDNWLVMNVRDRALPIIDATQVVAAFHQDHSARLLHRPDDRANLEILAEHEGGGAGNWAPRGRLTDANWLLVQDDLEMEAPGQCALEERFQMRHRVKMALVEMKAEDGPPALVPEGMVGLDKVRTPSAVPSEFLDVGPPPEPPELELVEIHHVDELIGAPVSDYRHEDLQPAVSARVQRILDRCSDGLRPATPDH